jgi:hypothetical protein
LTLVPKLPLNGSYFDSSSVAYFYGQPLKIRGNQQEETFVCADFLAAEFPLAGDADQYFTRSPIRRHCASGFAVSRTAVRRLHFLSSRSGGALAGNPPAIRTAGCWPDAEWRAR